MESSKNDRLDNELVKMRLSAKLLSLKMGRVSPFFVQRNLLDFHWNGTRQRVQCDFPSLLLFLFQKALETTAIVAIQTLWQTMKIETKNSGVQYHHKYGGKSERGRNACWIKNKTQSSTKPGCVKYTDQGNQSSKLSNPTWQIDQQTTLQKCRSGVYQTGPNDFSLEVEPRKS